MSASGRQQGRLRKSLPLGRALVLLAIGIAAVLVIEGLYQAGLHQGGPEGANGNADGRISQMQVMFADQALPHAAAPPKGFEEELLSPESTGAVLVSSNGRTVGFTIRKDPQSAFEAFKEELCAKGWASIPSGQGASSSFVKAAGTYTWAFVSCVEVSGETSVVVQLG